MDFQSPTWHHLRKWTEAQIQKAREKNDAVGLSDTDTAALRGEIRALKRILDLPNAATRTLAASADDQ